MAGVATQMTIRDGMTSKLNRIFQAVSRTNRALETTDALSDQVNPGANFDRAASAAGRASGQVDNFNNRQRQSEEGARKVASAWGLVKKAIGSALAAISVQKVIELADSMTSTRARLDIMNDGLQTTDELQSMIMKSANRSRAAYQTTADAVSKMGIMAKDAFSNNDELIKFTELINKQFTIAGTSAAGIDAAMLQLTQAMSSGVLRGEELNSVFEQAPTIIQTIADYLDVPIGKIRDMAADGQITSNRTSRPHRPSVTPPIRRRRKNLLTLRPHCPRPTPTPKRKPHRQKLTPLRIGMSTARTALERTTLERSVLSILLERLKAT